LGGLVREIGTLYRIDAEQRSVIGFSMGGSGAWDLPSFEPELFTKSVVIAGVCPPWALRHYPKTRVWVFVDEKDYMRKEQQETVSSAKRFGVDVVQTVWTDVDHGGIFKRAMSYQRMLDWLVKDEDLRLEAEPKAEFRPAAGPASGSERNQ
jgi:predicted peptidase